MTSYCGLVLELGTKGMAGKFLTVGRASQASPRLALTSIPGGSRSFSGREDVSVRGRTGKNARNRKKVKTFRSAGAFY
jgi:hypothetical protein